MWEDTWEEDRRLTDKRREKISKKRKKGANRDLHYTFVRSTVTTWSKHNSFHKIGEKIQKAG